MKKFRAIIIHLTILGLIVSGEWLDIKEARNIALFSVWLLAALTFLAALAPSEELFKDGKNDKSIIIRVIFFIEILALSACGSFVTATFYAMAWFVMWAKRLHKNHVRRY